MSTQHESFSIETKSIIAGGLVVTHTAFNGINEYLNYKALAAKHAEGNEICLFWWLLSFFCVGVITKSYFKILRWNK